MDLLRSFYDQGFILGRMALLHSLSGTIPGIVIYLVQHSDYLSRHGCLGGGRSRNAGAATSWGKDPQCLGPHEPSAGG